MKNYSSRELIKLVTQDGWYLVRHDGTSHQQYKHPTKLGLVTIPHPRKSIKTKTAKNILKQAGLL